MAPGDEQALHEQIDELLSYPREEMGVIARAGWI